MNVRKKEHVDRTRIVCTFLDLESSTSSPGGNQVDGLAPASSEALLHARSEQSWGSRIPAATGRRKNPLLGDEKFEFCELFCESFRLRQPRGAPRHPEVHQNVSIDVI